MIRYSGSKNSVTILTQEGTFKSTIQQVKLVIHGNLTVKKIQVNSKPVASQTTRMAFFEPLEKYDPIADPDPMGDEEVIESTFAYTPGQIEISW